LAQIAPTRHEVSPRQMIDSQIFIKPILCTYLLYYPG